MKLKKLSVGQKNHDLTIYKRGHIVFTKSLIKKLMLDKKRVVFSIDEDEPEKKLIFLNIDVDWTDSNSIEVKRSTSKQSYSLYCTRLANQLGIKMSQKYLFLKKTVINQQTYFIFKPVGEDKINDL